MKQRAQGLPNGGRLITLFLHEFHPSRLLPSLAAGLTAGVISVIYSISFAALIFSDDLSEYLSTGAGLALFTAVVVGAVVTLMSSFPSTIATSQEATASILGLVASTIATSMPASASAEQTFLTVVATIVFTSILTGIFFFSLGLFKLGGLIRFLPYPVIGGYLAGAGWLLVGGSINLMANVSLSFSQLPELFKPDVLVKWLPGLIFAALMLVILRRYSHFLIVPGMLLGAIALFYIVLLFTGTSVAEASASGLLLGPFPEGGLWRSLSFLAVTQANWLVIFGQIGNLVTVLLLGVVALLLNASAIELAVEQDIDLNRELQVAGIANLAVSLGSGIVGFHSLSLSTLGHRVGANSRMVGLFSTALCAMALFLGASVLSFLPKSVLGGLVLFLGLTYLVEWIYDARFKLPRADYFIVLSILFVIGALGLLQGIGVGIVAAVILFIVNYSRIDVTRHSLSGASHQSNVARPLHQVRLLREQGDQIYILELQGLIFFGTANKLLNQVCQRASAPNQQPLRFVMLDFRLVNGLDSSAVFSFVKMKQIARKQQLSLVFTNLQPTVQKQLRQGGCIETQDFLCQIFPDLDRGLEWCENQILETISWRRRRFLPMAMQLKQLFSSADQVSNFMRYLEPLQALKGHFVIRKGDPSAGLYFVESGQVSVLLEMPDGQTKRLRTLVAGTIFGEMGLYTKMLPSASVVTDQPSRLYYLSAAALDRMETEAPLLAQAFHKFLVGLLAQRIDHMEKELQSLIQ